MPGIVLSILYTAIFIFIIRRARFFHIEDIPKKWIELVFILKILAGTALWYVYTRFYTDRLTADIFKYFDDGKVIYNALFSKPGDYFKMLFAIPDPALNHYYQDDMRHWTRAFGMGLYNENRTLIRFNALIDVFSFGNYHVHTVFICFLSLTGLMGIYKSFIPYLAEKRKGLFAAVFLLPSVLFWGSGVLKEGLVLFSLGICIYHYFKLTNGGWAIKSLALVILFIFLLAVSKTYILFAILPALLAHFLIVKTKYTYPGIKYLAVLALICCIGLLLPNYHFPSMLMEKQHQAIYMARGGSYLGNQTEKKFVYIAPETKNRIIKLKDQEGFGKIVPGVPYVTWNLETHLDSTYVKNSADTSTYWIYYDQPAAGSYITIPFINGTIASVLTHSPLAFVTTIFRPHVLEMKNPFMVISAIENLLILVFIIICIAFHLKKIPNKHLIYFCICIVVLLFTLIGLTTPILGAVVRYKIPALPFLLIAFLLVLDKQKLLKKFPFLNKIIA